MSYHQCDECGETGPPIGKQERICYWVCPNCVVDIANSPLPAYTETSPPESPKERELLTSPDIE